MCEYEGLDESFGYIQPISHTYHVLPSTSKAANHHLNPLLAKDRDLALHKQLLLPFQALHFNVFRGIILCEEICLSETIYLLFALFLFLLYKLLSYCVCSQAGIQTSTQLPTTRGISF